MKRFLTLLLCLTMLVSMAALPATSLAEETVELTFYYPVGVGGDLALLIENLAAEFTKENPNIIINPVFCGNSTETTTKTIAAIQGGNAPDFAILGNSELYSMLSLEAIIPLDDLIAADEDGQEYIDDFWPAFLQNSYYDGHIYSIPFQRSTMVMFYNKDAFEEVGLDPEAPPTTWDEMVEYAQKLTNENRYGVGIALNSGSAQWAFTGFSLQNCTNGVGLMSADGKEVYFNTPENIEALQLWLDLQNKYMCMAPGIVQWTDLPTQFLAGEVAMIYHTTGNLTNIKNNATFDFGVCFLPAGRQYGAPTGGGNFYITNGISEERQKAAWEFIKFCCSTERAAQWSIDTGYVATRESCYETQLLKDYYADFPQALVAYEQLPYAQPELTTYSAAEMWRILNDNIQAAVTGEMTAAEALEAAQQQGDDLLFDYQ